MRLTRRLGAWLAPSASAAAIIGVFHLFFVYDIGFGWLRGPLLLVLAGTTLLPAWFGKASGSRFLPKRVAASLLLVLVAIPTGYAITWANRDFRSEMGEIHLRAVPLLLQGVNPWGRSTVLDPVVYLHAIGVAHAMGCTDWTRDDASRRLDTFWEHPSKDLLPTLHPTLSEDARCRPARQWVESVGYRWGPVLLISYAPWILLWGRPGIYACHLVWLLLLCACVLWLLSSEGIAWFRTEAIAAIAVMLIPLLLRRVTLRHTDCDLFPTLLAFSGVVALVRNRPALAAARFGFSVGAKLLPGVLYLPLLLKMPRRAIGVFCLVLGTCFLPLAIADLPSAYQQMIGFNVIRGTSSTALPYFLPEWLAMFLRVLALICVAVIAWRYVWSGRQTAVGILKYLLCAHVAFLFSAKLLHNNYLVWVFPIVAALMALLLRPTRISDELSCRPRAAASVPAGRPS